MSLTSACHSKLGMNNKLQLAVLGIDPARRQLSESQMFLTFFFVPMLFSIRFSHFALLTVDKVSISCVVCQEVLSAPPEAKPADAI